MQPNDAEFDKSTKRHSVMVRPAGFEPATHGLEGRCSIQLSYGRIEKTTSDVTEVGRSGGIRTPDPLVPNQMRYQTALHSDCTKSGVLYSNEFVSCKDKLHGRLPCD